MRHVSSIAVLSALSCLALAPTACSDDQSHPAVGSGDAAAAGMAGHETTDHAGEPAAGSTTAGSTTAGSTTAGGGGVPSDAGSPTEGGTAGAPVAEGGMAGATYAGSGGAAGEADGPVLGSSGRSGECAAVVTSYRLSPGVHVTECSPIVYSSNPPSSGEHYPTWADFGAYDFPLPRGFWMHNLEHGAVVVTYHCPAGCDADLAKAQAWLSELAPDAACPDGPPRILLVPDPLLDVPWAASSWGFTLRADCFDPEAFTDFFVSHAGQPLAPEAGLCGTGFDFRVEGADACGAK